jgi:hypothetical protein
MAVVDQVVSHRSQGHFQNQVILEGPQLVHKGAYDSIAWEPSSGDVFGNRKDPRQNIQAS